MGGCSYQRLCRVRVGAGRLAGGVGSCGIAPRDGKPGDCGGEGRREEGNQRHEGGGAGQSGGGRRVFAGEEVVEGRKWDNSHRDDGEDEIPKGTKIYSYYYSEVGFGVMVPQCVPVESVVLCQIDGCDGADGPTVDCLRWSFDFLPGQRRPWEAVEGSLRSLRGFFGGIKRGYLRLCRTQR